MEILIFFLYFIVIYSLNLQNLSGNRIQKSGKILVSEVLPSFRGKTKYIKLNKVIHSLKKYRNGILYINFVLNVLESIRLSRRM